MENYMYLVPVAAVIALIFAAYLARKVGRQSAGTERMKEIAAAIAEGARAFLTAEYKILIIFVAVLFVLIGIGIGNWVTAICFVVGALFSTVAGYCGMTVATKANVRTANAAKESGMNKALSIAFSGGAVMGMCVAGLGALDENGNIVLGDEMLTPDSSRFWPADGYEPGHGQPSFDKQFARDWLTSHPGNDWTLPQEIVDKTIAKYLEAYEMITGKKLEA